MKLTFEKYQGAGNDFILIDNRKGGFDGSNEELIAKLCDRRFGIGADGLMLLESHNDYDFVMRYFNSDGPEASMCGNGGRCIVAFARRMGIIDRETKFLAVDGEHDAVVEADNDVNLKMIDVPSVEIGEGFYYMDTGSPHYVTFHKSLDGFDVVGEGKAVRYGERFKSVGTNVNFVEKSSDHLRVLTYERGVEDETLACGTGITACALSAALIDGKDKGAYSVSAKGGELSVSFEKHAEGFKNVWLKGPAEFVFEGTIEL